MRESDTYFAIFDYSGDILDNGMYMKWRSASSGGGGNIGNRQ